MNALMSTRKLTLTCIKTVLPAKIAPPPPPDQPGTPPPTYGASFSVFKFGKSVST